MPMTSHQQELSPDQMTTFIDRNLTGMIPIVSKMGRLTTSEPPGVMRAIVDIPYSLFNGIADTRLTAEQVEPAIQFIVADARSRQTPVLWWVTPSTQPAGLAEQLKKHGFTLQDDQPGMAVELNRLSERLKKVPGLSIRLAQDEASWWQWSRTMVAGFEIPPAAEFVVTAWRDLFSQVDPEIVLPYIGYLDDQPVATSVLSLVGGAAGIYGVSTIPSARRKGIGAWMTLQPLLDGREKGYTAGVLQASEMGESVYLSLGFREYCRIRSYQFGP